MALIDFNKLKQDAQTAAQNAASGASQFLSSAKDKAGEVTNEAIRKMLKGIDLDGLLQRVDEYQQKTGRDASKLTEFINNLKNMQQDGEGE
jgi:hypothetical protein